MLKVGVLNVLNAPPRANGVRREKSDPSEGLSEAKLPQNDPKA